MGFINSIRLDKQPNNKQLEFHTQVKFNAKHCKLEEKIGDEILNKYYADLEKEEGINAKSLASEHTEAIQKEDGVQDNLIIGLDSIIDAYERFPDEGIVATAKRMNITRKPYGDLAGMPIEQGVAGVRNWHSDLTEKHAADVEKLGLGKWVAEIGASNKRLSDLISARFLENSAKITVPMVDIRKVVDKDYRSIIQRTEAYIVLNGLASLEEFVNLTNTVIAKYSGGKKTTGKDGQQSPEEPTTPTEPVEETHEEKMAKARPYTEINTGEWKNGDYCWHLLNSVKTYWKLLDATQKTVKPYMSGGEAVWEKLS